MKKAAALFGILALIATPAGAREQIAAFDEKGLAILNDELRRLNKDVDVQEHGAAFGANKGGTDQTGVGTGSWTKVTFSSEDFDTEECFAGSKFTPNVRGKYLLVGTVLWTASVDQSAHEIAIYKNGTLHRSGAVARSSGTGSVGNAISVLVDADGSDDFFELYAKQTTGSDKVIEGTAADTWFQGHRVSE